MFLATARPSLIPHDYASKKAEKERIGYSGPTLLTHAELLGASRTPH